MSALLLAFLLLLAPAAGHSAAGAAREENGFRADEAALRESPPLTAFDDSCARLSAGTGRHGLSLLKSLDLWSGERPLRLYAVESRCEAFERSFADPPSLFALGPWGIQRLGPLCGAGVCRASAGDPVEVSTGPFKAFVLTRSYGDSAASSREVYLVRPDTSAWRSWKLPADLALGRGAAGAGTLDFTYYFGRLGGAQALALSAHAHDSSRLGTPLEFDLRYRQTVPLEGGLPVWGRSRTRFAGGTSTLLADARAYADPGAAEPAFTLAKGRAVRLLQRKRAGQTLWWSVYDGERGVCWVRATSLYSNPKLVSETLLEAMEYPEPEFESDTVWVSEDDKVYCAGRNGRSELLLTPAAAQTSISEDRRRLMLLRAEGQRLRLELWDARTCKEEWLVPDVERVLGEARVGADKALSTFLALHPSPGGQRPFKAVLYDELGRPAWNLGEYDLVFDLRVSPNGRHALIHHQLKIGPGLRQFITRVDIQARGVESLPADALSHPDITDEGEVVER
ncbi:MAG TPA: hypothetical protein DCM05_09320 [Elusimicrobia bacterium]|nr:hypothetical protein [Elusimicrobiota bacterium]